MPGKKRLLGFLQHILGPRAGHGKYRHKEGWVPPSKTPILASKRQSSFTPPDPLPPFSTLLCPGRQAFIPHIDWASSSWEPQGYG